MKPSNRRGSNQYATRRKSNIHYLAFLYLSFALILFGGHVVIPNIPRAPLVNADNPEYRMISPLPFQGEPGLAELRDAMRSASVTPAPVPEAVTPTPKRDRDIETLIRQVFGAHADKALQVLACENSSLDPDAVNTAGNHPAGSRDIGVFQINEYWQKTQGRFLFDPEINVRAAWRIYEDDGYSFKLWTCGRKLGL